MLLSHTRPRNKSTRKTSQFTNNETNQPGTFTVNITEQMLDHRGFGASHGDWRGTMELQAQRVWLRLQLEILPDGRLVVGVTDDLGRAVRPLRTAGPA